MELNARAERDIAFATLGRTRETSRATIGYARFGEVVVVTNRGLVIGSARGVGSEARSAIYWAKNGGP